MSDDTTTPIPAEAIKAAARAIRDKITVGPFGPNALRILNSGGATHLNGGEADEAARVALAAAAPVFFAAGRTTTACGFDPEQHASSYNQGYEEAVAQGLADDPSIAADWLAARDARLLAAESERIASLLSEQALLRFDAAGPHDKRGAAFWDAAAYIRERAAKTATEPDHG